MMLTKADVKGALEYLRGSYMFQASDGWKKALDKAMKQIGFM